MNILYLSGAVIPSTSAYSIQVVKMCNALAQNGHNVTLVATRGTMKEKINFFEYYNVKESFTIALSNNINKFSFISRIFKSLKLTRNADIIYTRWPLIAWLITTLFEAKIIFEYHSPPSSKFNNFFISSSIKSGKIIRHVFITNALKKYYLKNYLYLREEDTVVLPDGADPIILNSERKDIIAKDEKTSCGYLGSFQQGKGVELILELANKEPGFEFHIVGGNDLQISKLQKRCQHKNVIWYGHLSHKDAMKVLYNVDIALLPNQPNVLVGPKKYDIGQWTSPMKLFEYMALGKPIVASDLPVLREILDGGVNAVLVAHDNSNEWINAIRLLRADSNLSMSLGNNAKKELEAKYSWKIRAGKVLMNLK